MSDENYASRWLGHALERSGITQTALAEKSGISRAHICRILKGSRAVSLRTLIHLIEACGFEIIELRVKPREKKANESGRESTK